MFGNSWFGFDSIHLWNCTIKFADIQDIVNVVKRVERQRHKTNYYLRTIFRFTQGICPGNRLKVIASYEPRCYSPLSPVSSPCPSTPSIYYNSSILSNDSGGSLHYENTSGNCMNQQKHGKRRSWHIMPNKVSYASIELQHTHLDADVAMVTPVDFAVDNILHDMFFFFSVENPTQYSLLRRCSKI